VGAQYVHTFGATLLNEFRFGYHRANKVNTGQFTNTNFKACDVGIKGLLQGGPDGRELTMEEAGFPSITIAGFLGIGS